MYVDPTFIRHAARALALVGITMLFGCLPSSQHETGEADEAHASSMKAFSFLKVLAARTHSAEGYRTVQEGHECWAHQDSTLNIARSRGDYLLLRYSPADSKKQWAESR